MINLSSLYPRFPLKLPLLLDGATGTNLMRLGLPKGACAETWVDAHPDAIRAIQSGYLRAGSDVVYAPTFGANLPSLARHGIPEDRADALNRRLFALTSDLCSEAGKTAVGDLSPTGLMLAPAGEASFDDVADVYSRQARSIGAPLYVTETNISLAEARAAVCGVKAVSDAPVFVTVTVGENGRTLCGDTPLCSLITLAASGAAAFGLNCSTGPAEMAALIKPLLPYSLALGVPLIAKPNAGLPSASPDGGQTFPLGPDEFASLTASLLSSGVLISGGCCGTDDRYIAKLRKLLDGFDFSPVFGGVKPAGLENTACTNSVMAKVDPAQARETLARPSEDGFEDLVYDSELPYAAAELQDRADLDALNEFTASLRKPLALAGDPGLISRFERSWCGKAVRL